MIQDGTYTFTNKAAATADEAGVAANANLRLMGYTIRESAAGTATVDMSHGAAAGTIIFSENLAASTSVFRWFGPAGIPVPLGVWIERLTGNTAVTIITKTA
jgi:hypothetical protein